MSAAFLAQAITCVTEEATGRSVIVRGIDRKYLPSDHIFSLPTQCEFIWEV